MSALTSFFFTLKNKLNNKLTGWRTSMRQTELHSSNKTLFDLAISNVDKNMFTIWFSIKAV